MASGDDGSAPGGPDGNFGDKLFPEWPASSGWVTAVGATRFVDHKVGQPEMASDAIGSGGGFSTMFSIANESQYQAADVANYFKVAPQLPPAATFPKTGRGTPDVSALGEAYTGVINGDLSYDNSGTSASTPVFAAIISLLNEARIQAGKPQLGFLNPWIYQNTDAFTDVTLGNNAISISGKNRKYGFNCTKGWDPVTGVGTPIFSKMLVASRAPTPPPPTPPAPPTKCTKGELAKACPRKKFKNSKKCLHCAEAVKGCHGPKHRRLRRANCGL